MMEEAKFPAFSNVSYSSICIEISYIGKMRSLAINQPGRSLLDTFKSKNYVVTNEGLSDWRNLLDGSRLESKCYKEGLNVQDNKGTMIARIGIMGSDFTNCDSPDAYIGIGTFWLPPISCKTDRAGTSCGNIFKCFTALRAFGYIYIQQ